MENVSTGTGLKAKFFAARNSANSLMLGDTDSIIINILA